MPRISWSGVATVFAHPEIVVPLCLGSAAAGAAGMHHFGPWFSALFARPDPIIVVQRLMDLILDVQKILTDAIDQLRARARRSLGEPFSVIAFVAKVPGAEAPDVMEARYRLIYKMVVSVAAEASVVVELRHEQRKIAEPVLWEHIHDAHDAVTEFRVRVVSYSRVVYSEIHRGSVADLMKEIREENDTLRIAQM
ncbi:hypothetical protein PHLGIDRAFT_404217 [Phlebiopsis gigantea 11061_1 CR5-6]|uniref:Uncharacterized protein n=1 Tax=Phlebiopsis gigantea (strain 11061_1 CR5-6) TaxID=745531 RepID=A0A0C3RZR6_PHLG1|nr:hypothetical protein PHLGIDRAFT_404217 [Phlebiopsis gigantea 11061_1 CR5-6]